MDHTRDNPLKRFTAFWIAFLMVATFGIGCIILRPLTHAKVTTATQEAASDRLKIKNEVLDAEAKALNVTALKSAMANSAKSLSSAPAPEPGSMAVPTSAPVAAPAETPAPAEAPAAAETPSEPSN